MDVESESKPEYLTEWRVGPDVYHHASREVGRACEGVRRGSGGGALPAHAFMAIEISLGDPVLGQQLFELGLAGLALAGLWGLTGEAADLA